MASASVNHVGMVVPSIEAFLRKTAALYGGFSRGEIIVNHRQAVRELFLSDGKHVIELLEPMGPTSPLAPFLENNPEGGLVHLALDVDDLAAELVRLREGGAFIVSGPVPDVAFGERSIAFVLIGGQLTELIERPKAGGAA